MTILITGGAGYIGSHTVLALLERGADVVVIDNLCNSSPESLRQVEKLTGKSVKFYQGDILDLNLLNKIFQENKIDTVIHFAGLKAVGESARKPTRVLSKQCYWHFSSVTGYACQWCTSTDFQLVRNGLW